jgi:hypothetical protein
MRLAHPSRLALLLAALAPAVAACPRTPAASPPPSDQRTDTGDAAEPEAPSPPATTPDDDGGAQPPAAPPDTDSPDSPPPPAAPRRYPLDAASADPAAPTAGLAPLAPTPVFPFASDWNGTPAPVIGARVGPQHPAPDPPALGSLVEVPVDRNGNVTAAAPVVRTFEKTFTVADPSTVVAAFAEARFAGGIVVRLNGQEWFRSQVDPESDGPADPAFEDPDDGRYWLRRRQGGIYQRSFPGLDPSLLRPGDNLLAVDVHRPPAPDADPPLHFDLRLDLYTAHGLVVAPFLTASAAGAATVAWETTAPSVGRVRYGAGPDADREAGDGDRCAVRHEVPLPPLDPGAAFAYGLEWSPCAAWAPEADREPRWNVAGSVRGLPAPGSPFSFLAYGDSRNSPTRHAKVVAAMQAATADAPPAFVVNTGDLTNVGTDEQEWREQFFAPLAPLLAQIPLVPVFGNHDLQDEDWFDRLALPGNEAWYSWRAGDVELFVLDTYAKFAPGADQFRWLEEALAASTAPWKILALHLPLRSCHVRRDRRETADRVAGWLAPLLAEHGVRLVLSGHDHLYGRATLDEGPTVVTLGGGGAPTYEARAPREGEVCVATLNFARVDVSPDRLRLRAFDPDGLLLDDFELTREPDEPAADGTVPTAGEPAPPPTPATD